MQHFLKSLNLDKKKGEKELKGGSVNQITFVHKKEFLHQKIALERLNEKDLCYVLSNKKDVNELWGLAMKHSELLELKGFVHEKTYYPEYICNGYNKLLYKKLIRMSGQS